MTCFASRNTIHLLYWIKTSTKNKPKLVKKLKFIIPTYGSGVGGFGLDTNFSIGRSGLTSFFGEGVLGGVGPFSGVGDGGGVGVGDLKSSVSSIGSGDGTSRKASCS